MAKLFMFYLGGGAPRAQIEVHDVQFVVADAVEDAYPILRERWYGTPWSLHVDGVTDIRWADGHDVTLSDQPAQNGKKLYFIFMGGYSPGDLMEYHKMGLFVAESLAEAKASAKARLMTEFTLQHRDNHMEVERCALLSELHGTHIHLKPNPFGMNLGETWHGYRRIGPCRICGKSLMDEHFCEDPELEDIDV
jgi:hypothetical protein